jgi:hypothetical protein
MVRVCAAVAEQTMPFACLESARKPTTRSIPRGEYLVCWAYTSTKGSSSYVEMLEQQQAQLVAGLQELYRRTQNGQGWEGPPLKESSHGTPLTHDILERLGSLRAGRHNSETEQRRLLDNGAGLMQQTISDSGSDSGLSPASDRVPQKPRFSDAFSFGKLPPTPPTQSPYPQIVSPEFPFNTHNVPHPLPLPKGVHGRVVSGQMWATTEIALGSDSMLLDQYDSPVSLNPASNPFDPSQMPVGTIAPFLSMRDWNHDIDFQGYSAQLPGDGMYESF